MIIKSKVSKPASKDAGHPTGPEAVESQIDLTEIHGRANLRIGTTNGRRLSLLKVNLGG